VLFFALQALYKGIVSVDALVKILNTVSETGRLSFVDQYLQTSISIRVKFGFTFNCILKNIKTRNSVLNFYALLFDMKRDADPFLNNLSFSLRDPSKIIKKELASELPKIKVVALKALALILSRLDSKLLLNILTKEGVRKVRITIYNIIKNASVGVYSELYEPTLNKFIISNSDEAKNSFRALVVTGEVPPHELIDIIKTKKSEFLPILKFELSLLSKVSFFIQDVGLNRGKYAGSNFDINLTCVLEMIKKRPEQVVLILKKYDNDFNDSFRMDITNFIEMTKSLLTK
jgi:adenylate cyclase, class 1